MNDNDSSDSATCIHPKLIKSDKMTDITDRQMTTTLLTVGWPLPQSDPNPNIRFIHRHVSGDPIKLETYHI